MNRSIIFLFLKACTFMFCIADFMFYYDDHFHLPGYCISPTQSSIINLWCCSLSFCKVLHFAWTFGEKESNLRCIKHIGMSTFIIEFHMRALDMVFSHIGKQKWFRIRLIKSFQHVLQCKFKCRFENSHRAHPGKTLKSIQKLMLHGWDLSFPYNTKTSSSLTS